jgi:hypothetical protein
MSLQMVDAEQRHAKLQRQSFGEAHAHQQ